MEAIAARHARDWPRGRPFRLLSRLRDVADEIFVRLVLGVRDERIAASLSAAMRRMLRTPGNPPITLPGPRDGLMGALGKGLFERRRAPLVRELTRAAEARRREALGEDVLGLLLGDGLGIGAIVDELSSLLMAAQEPPSLALGWMLDRLAREPDLRAAFLADPRGPRADEIVRETLRLRPPASGVLRRLREPLPAGGWLLPAGVTVLVPTTLMQRDERLFFPFGGGARRCIGEALARAEIQTVVPAVLGQVRLAPLAAEPEPLVQRATVLAPKRGLLVRAD
jgi:cytochrome P450